MNVAVYYRVSTKGQAEDDKQGLPVQRDIVGTYCSGQGYTITAVYEDAGYSGATAARPGLAQMLADAGSGLFDAVVVREWSRVARDAMLFGYVKYRLSERGVSLLSATEVNGDDAQSRLFQTILAAVAEYDKAMIVQRLHAARLLKASKGGYAHGKPRIGYAAPGTGMLEPNESEMRALQMAKQLRRGRKSYRAIAAALNEAGLLARSGKPWAHSTVYAMLRRR